MFLKEASEKARQLGKRGKDRKKCRKMQRAAGAAEFFFLHILPPELQGKFYQEVQVSNSDPASLSKYQSCAERQQPLPATPPWGDPPASAGGGQPSASRSPLRYHIHLLPSELNLGTSEVTSTTQQCDQAEEV